MRIAWLLSSRLNSDYLLVQRKAACLKRTHGFKGTSHKPQNFVVHLPRKSVGKVLREIGKNIKQSWVQVFITELNTPIDTFEDARHVYIKTTINFHQSGLFSSNNLQGRETGMKEKNEVIFAQKSYRWEEDVKIDTAICNVPLHFYTCSRFFITILRNFHIILHDRQRD